MSHAYVIDAVRTPRGRGKAGKGALSGIHPQELLAQTLRALAERNALALDDVDDVIAGVVSQVGEQGANLARNAVLAAGFPYSISGTSVNRFCGSGLQAISFAAMGVASGQQDLVLAGGVESMSRVAMGSDGGGMDGGNLDLRSKIFQVPQGISADLIATLEGFTRDDVDQFALGSQKKAAHAMEEKRFAKSLVPVTDASGKVLLAVDEFPRADTTLEGLQKLQPAFATMGASIIDEGRSLDEIARHGYPAATAIHHVHTAGNSSGSVDGAGAVIIASEGTRKRTG
ncbi:hypothetical protein BH09MYX1_BH09MYX1_36330 [soil metagenome]